MIGKPQLREKLIKGILPTIKKIEDFEAFCSMMNKEKNQINESQRYLIGLVAEAKITAAVVPFIASIILYAILVVISNFIIASFPAVATFAYLYYLYNKAMIDEVNLIHNMINSRTESSRGKFDDNNYLKLLEELHEQK